MQPDLDDTVEAPPRPVGVAGERYDRVDAAQDDTVVRPRVPPALVEPPIAPGPLLDAGPAAVPSPIVLTAAPSPVSATPRLLLPDGTELDLEVPVYVGRRPSTPRIHTGPPPRLVTVRSPRHEISSTHLELSVLGGQVVVADMRSMNGTVVQLPGARPRTLLRGESAVATPGTRIDLGEGVVIDVLPPAAGRTE